MPHHPSPYVGRFCYRSSIKLFLSRDREEWIARMTVGFSNVTSHPLEQSQIRAWEDEYNVLHQALSALPEKYQKRQIIFEYVMPYRRKPSANDPGIRPDAIILSENTVVILEFKQHFEEEIAVYIKHQLLKYRRRIQDWHTASTGMRKKAIAVLTSEIDLRECCSHCTFCSPDRLAEVLMSGGDDQHMPREKVRAWLDSDWEKKNAKAYGGKSY